VRVSIGDVRLYFEVLGNQFTAAGEARPTVVGLHGGPGLDGGKLRYLLSELSDIAQVVVPDQRGHGLSDPGIPASWTLRQWADDVKAFCDALEIRRPIVLGESFGGFVAQQYATQFPDHPAAIVIVSSGPRIASVDELARRQRELEALLGAAATEMDRTASDRELAEVQQRRVRTMRVNEHFEPEGFRMDLRPGLAAIRCPVLILAGEHDPLVPPALARELTAALPTSVAELRVVPDASHEVLTDNPEAAWPLIKRFIASVADPTTLDN
jgi:proline iminopeptidase